MRTRARLVLAGIAATAFTLASAAPALADMNVEPVATDLAFPTNMAFAPDGRLFYVEKDTGLIRIIEDGQLLSQPFADTNATHNNLENGLLGLALDPAFPKQPYVYIYYSSATDEKNHIARIRADGDTGGTIENLMTLLPISSAYHNGGDLAFGPDGKLYITVGEMHDGELAQDPNSVGGKILRLNPDGSIPEDNPFGPDSAVYTLGHRNSFGICFDPDTGALWETENGPSSNDEVNLIEAGKNYGWPNVSGPSNEAPYTAPVLDFPVEVVPTGCVAKDGNVFFGDFHGQIHEFSQPDGRNLRDAATLPEGITDLQQGPDGFLYAATQDAIYRVSETASQSGSPTQSVSPAPPGPPTYSSRNLAIAFGILSLVVIFVGGLWFRRIQRRDDGGRSSGPTPPDA